MGPFRRGQAAVLTGALVAMAMACQVGCTDPAEPVRQITALSHDAIAIGETLYVIGSGEPPPADASVQATFSGSFAWRERGRDVVEEVRPFTVALVPDGTFTAEGTVGRRSVAPGEWLLRWNRFGPYAVPFGGRGTATGAFSGELTVEVVDGDTTATLPALPVTLQVVPSIVVHTLEPIIAFTDDGAPLTAPCGAPALRALPGLAYVIEAEAHRSQPHTI